MATVTLAKGFASSARQIAKTGMSPEALKEYKEAAAALNEQARDNWGPEFLRQVAADISSELDYGFTFENFFGTYFGFETVGEFDRVVLKERRGLNAYFTARGGYVDESQINVQEWEIPRDSLGFHVRESNDKLRANFADTISDLVTLGQQRLEAEVNRRAFSLLSAAVPSNASNYHAVAGITQPVVDAALIAVRDAVKPSGVVNVPITIIGRAAVVNEIANFAGFSPWALEEIRQDGFLGTYKGAQIVTLHNYTDQNDVEYLPANQLWIFGGTVGKMVKFGDLRTKAWEENTVDYTHFRASMSLGGLVHHPEQCALIVDSNIPA